jgi:hypothetical protein
MLGPNLTKAVIDMLYDNGMINRFKTELQQFQGSVEIATSKFSDFEIQQAEAFLSSLAVEEFGDFVAGSWNRCTLIDGETYADRILNEVFNNL